jgi:hydroxymethylpyrimidine pyrophosphatase-like HAD family hydrolase
MKHRHALFSDLDGTLVHFHSDVAPFATVETLPGQDPHSPNVLYTDAASGERRRCYTVPSSTAGPAYVSVQTHTLVQRLRAAGVLFVVVTAGRRSTLLSRIPLLPVADAYVGESGGRILLNPMTSGAPPLLATAPAAGALTLDREWAASLAAVTGDPELDSTVPPADRAGPLWDVFRELSAQGLNPDANSYWSCFRVDPAKSTRPLAEAQAILRDACATLPPSLAHASNLGKVDIYPAAAGKGNAVRHLLATFGVPAEDAFAMFDDDNDLPMAAAVGHGLVVRMLTPSVEAAVQRNPTWTVATRRGVLATEELLEHLLAALKPPGPLPYPFPSPDAPPDPDEEGQEG